MKCLFCEQIMLALPDSERFKSIVWYCPTHHVVDGGITFTSIYRSTRAWFDKAVEEQAREPWLREEVERNGSSGV